MILSRESLISGFEWLVLSESCRRIIQLGEYAVFATESSRVGLHCSNVIDVSVFGGRTFQVVYLGDPLLTHETLAQSLGVTHCRGSYIRFVTDQVVADTVQVVGCRDL